MSAKHDNGECGFTLLELLAAVALLVVLGTMLFQIFGQASHVLQVGNSHLEVFQTARALFRTLERELPGMIGYRDSAPSVTGTPMKVYTTSSALAASGLTTREGTDAITLVAALVGRDGVEGSPTYGQTANSAYIAYWVSPGDFTLNRFESYDVDVPTAGRGWEFALNVLEFRIECLDPYQTPVRFHRMDWNSSTRLPGGAWRGPPEAVRVTIKLTDSQHIGLWEFDASNKVSKLKDQYTADDDPIAQEFTEVIRVRQTE